MAQHKQDRVNETVRRHIAEILMRVKDPRINSFVSVTGASVSPDMKFCRIFVAAMGDEKQKVAAFEGLKSAKGFIRRELAELLTTRNTPEIVFDEDTSIETGIRIEEILKNIKRDDCSGESK